MQGSFEKNLKYLEDENPLLALKLRLLEPKPKKDLEKTPGLLSIKKNTEVIYYYGLASCYIELKTWLHSNHSRRLIFFEDDLDRFRHFLNQPESERILLDPQVKIVALTEPFEESIKEVVWAQLFRPYEIFIMPGKSDTFLSLLTNVQMGAEMAMCLYRDYGIPQLKNVLSNLGFTGEIHLGDQLQGKFKGIPAIICGAGPSLDEDLKQLKKLGDQALIFAGGSALGPLSQEQVPIHFGASLDPEPPSERFLSQTYFELPFFYQNQVSNELFSKLQGDRICLGEGGGFPLERWLQEQIGIKLAPIDAGTHVGTFLTHIAEMLGCSPIIFVGMDGCTAGEKVYSDGVDLVGRQEKRNDPLTTVDRFGNPVQSRMDFLLGRSWIEAFATKHPETCFLNATGRGLSMKGVENISLEEIERKFLTKHFDTKALCHQVLQKNDSITLQNEKVNHAILQVRGSLKKCLDFCDELLKLLERDASKSTYQNSRYALQDQELSEEIFFEMVLTPLWNVWRLFLQKDAIIKAMQMPDFEKKVQEVLFYRDVCLRYERMMKT